MPMDPACMNQSEPPLTLAARCARRILLATQRSRFRGVGGYSPEAFAARQNLKPFPQASRESSLYKDFFAFFQGSFDAEGLIRDKTVLDFGSGYGGRTVDYARIGAARFVWGVEPEQIHTDLSQQYARSMHVDNVEFRTCGGTSVPLQDESVDVVVSYDVLEHVISPPASVKELFRVLRPGGTALLVFPVYLGMRSHHLDYITTLPGLHWIFGADTLVSAVNSILNEDPEMTLYGTRRQPTPRMSFDGRRRVLPLLNGLGGSHLSELFRQFSILQINRHVVLRSKPGLRALTTALSQAPMPMRLRDAVTDSVSCVLTKPSS
jgi:SAM-dependent methyltransferase